jgi:hypothetical protein
VVPSAGGCWEGRSAPQRVAPEVAGCRPRRGGPRKAQGPRVAAAGGRAPLRFSAALPNAASSAATNGRLGAGPRGWVLNMHEGAGLGRARLGRDSRVHPDCGPHARARSPGPGGEGACVQRVWLWVSGGRGKKPIRRRVTVIVYVRDCVDENYRLCRHVGKIQLSY